MGCSGHCCLDNALKINLNLYIHSDIEECVENQTICGPDAKCSNTEGSYYCTCHSGFVASNKQEKFNASQGVQCEGAESSGQQFNPTVPTLLPLILWILMFYQ
ncbi:adhesion G protein-coupled receptor E2-like [Clarias gariepinus]|uniref:adhesion G protein-coupled receptor E2-like n=1 Tax=Clarias gariepinus TaxID=13013 RepID=UPI00234DAF2E|nr:adhesion G protein-coupled receptor E2-like [Clarias gariepinus]